LPTNLLRPLSFLAGETDNPDSVEYAEPGKRRAPIGRRRLGALLQLAAVVLLLFGVWWLAGVGVAAVVAAALLGAAGVLIEMGRF
jgi:hypothetical protein